MLSTGTAVRMLGAREVQAKLAAAAPRIFENNWAMTRAMLDWAKTETHAATPTGPGHFGYHGRDSMKVEMSHHGWTVVGKLKGAAQLYWREFGTRGRSRKLAGALGLRIRELKMAYKQGAFGSGGERAYMTAHHALGGARAIVRAFYGKSLWWRL